MMSLTYVLCSTSILTYFHLALYDMQDTGSTTLSHNININTTSSNTLHNPTVLFCVLSYYPWYFIEHHETLDYVRTYSMTTSGMTLTINIHHCR